MAWRSSSLNFGKVLTAARENPHTPSEVALVVFVPVRCFRCWWLRSSLRQFHSGAGKLAELDHLNRG